MNPRRQNEEDNYMVTNPKGETVNYKFDDIDLPYSSKP